MSSLENQLSPSSTMPQEEEEEEEEEAFGKAWCLRTSGLFSYILDAAIQLRVFDILAKAGPDAKLSSKQIASEIRAKNPDAPSLLDRMLRLLVCYELITCSISPKLDAGAGNGEDDGEKLYGPTLAGEAFVNDGDKGSLAAFTMNKAKIEVWLQFKDLVMEGGNLFEKVHGMPSYKYRSLNPNEAKRFDTAMTNLSKRIVKKVLEKYQGFEGITTLVDAGGGYGVTLNMIISKYPAIKAINYDLPHVIQQAPSFPGIEHVAGNMFSSVPKAYAIMMKEVLHNWDDEHCLKLLKNCYESLEENGKVIVISYMMVEEADASNTSKLICQLDLNMAMQFGAKQRTAKQFKSMAIEAGFSSFKVKCIVFDMVAVMEFCK